MIPRIRVVAALIAHPAEAGSYLVQQRLATGSRANLWEFPGGKVEPGESDAQALIRECREELDVSLSVGPRLWGTVHTYSDLEVVLELFGATITAGEPKPLGAQALRFCTPQQMQALAFCEADVPLIAALQAGLGAAT